MLSRSKRSKEHADKGILMKRGSQRRAQGRLKCVTCTVEIERDQKDRWRMVSGDERCSVFLACF